MENLRRIIANTPPQEGGLSTIAERIRLYLHEHLLDQSISIEFLEAHLGMNRRSLQRKFKAAFDLTIRDYLRQERLACAYRALGEDGVIISRAAYLAGYSSTENFTTAFRRNFSLRPCDLHNISI
ncbi:helix-turn-helix transcriptional regulator [Paracoccus sp. JM45]|uniref:helix-turn-helix transcriptional regulator n=1 Tax=Paracoccus sp. JM45 TaxID=2283626 RepID=UPI000E6C09EE|nr:AraC family transcriptional regulator [Paracoccus sp. JM45]RJE78697.1 AraC family transcriptional regulator [Paracoccus sp. JM45]